jgi:hypothetical protein
LWQLWLVHAKKEDMSLILQGSLIEMTGPKRGIALNCDVLFEFDMRIKNGEQEENDLQLIDGVTEFYEIRMPCKPFTTRINGDAGAVDMSLTNVYGVEATVEIFISKVENGFDLSICCVVSVLEEHKEFQLFGAPIGESCGLRRFVIAVEMDTMMHLKFKVHQHGSNVEHCCSFEAKMHGCASHDIKLEVASLSVKVTWSALIE